MVCSALIIRKCRLSPSCPTASSRPAIGIGMQQYHPRLVINRFNFPCRNCIPRTRPPVGAIGTSGSGNLYYRMPGGAASTAPRVMYWYKDKYFYLSNLLRE